MFDRVLAHVKGDTTAQLPESGLGMSAGNQGTIGPIENDSEEVATLAESWNFLRELVQMHVEEPKDVAKSREHASIRNWCYVEIDRIEARLHVLNAPRVTLFKAAPLPTASPQPEEPESIVVD